MKKIDSFRKFHNFCYERDGVRIWRCYGIGEGKLIPYKLLIVKPQGPTSLVTDKPFFPISQSRVLKPDKKTIEENLTVFVCPEPGCKKKFAKFADFELHLDVVEHIMQDATSAQETNVYDKIRKDWANRFVTIQTENSQQRSCQTDSANSKGVESKVCLGWALPKIRGGATQFSPKVKDYLTAKFDLGEKTGQKVDADQVAKDMRNARTVANQRRFSREDWLSKTQVQGFFSRLASARRKRGSKESRCEEEEDDEDTEDVDQEQRQVVEEVMNDLGLKHPIVFNVYNVCQYYQNNELSSFNMNMLRDMCRHFQISFKYRDLKKVLLAKVADLVKECACCKK